MNTHRDRQVVRDRREKKKHLDDMNNFDLAKIDDYYANDLKKLAKHLGLDNIGNIKIVKERIRQYYELNPPKKRCGRPRLYELKKGEEFDPNMIDKYKHTTIRQEAYKLGIKNYRGAEINKLRKKIREHYFESEDSKDVEKISFSQNVDFSSSVDSEERLRGKEDISELDEESSEEHKHDRSFSREEPSSQGSGIFVLIKKIGNHREYEYLVQSNNYINYIENVKEDLHNLLIDSLKEFKPIKCYLNLYCEFERGTKHKLENEFKEKVFSLNPFTINRESDIDNKLNNVDDFTEKISTFTENGSGWKFNSINKLHIYIHKTNWRGGKSYVVLPPCIANTKAIINIKNDDDRCMEYTLLYHKHKNEIGENPQRVAKYKKYLGDINFGKCKFPIKQSDIEKIEKLNDIAIVVIELEEDSEGKSQAKQSCGFTRIPFYTNEKVNGESYSTNKTSDGKDVYFIALYKEHYMPIKKISALFTNGRDHKNYTCLHCLNSFKTQKSLNEHDNLCLKDGVKSRLPTPGKKDTIKFNQYSKMGRHPFTVYFDTECTTKPSQGSGPLEQSGHAENKTKRINEHKPNAVACLIKCDIKAFEYYNNRYEVFYGDNAMDQFLYYIQQISNILCEYYDDLKDVKMIKPYKNWIDFKSKNACDFCGDEFKCRDDGKSNKCAYFDVGTHDYIGAAHHRCSFDCQYRQNPNITIVGHNGSNYDFHFILEKAGKYFKPDCIPKSREKYSVLSFDGGTIKFIDSISFLQSSLDTLVKNNDNDDFQIFRHFFPSVCDEELLRKGVFPYEYITSLEVLNEKSLPSKEKFYSRLNEKEISNEDYEHAIHIFKKYQCKNIWEYLLLYLKLDVILLADVFEKFRQMCIDENDLDPIHFVSAPHRAYVSALLMTGVEIKLITDLNTHLIVEGGIRGGVSQISHRHSRANNPYLKDYDPNKPTKYIMYLDMNNLYGSVMCKPLPTSDFIEIENKFSTEDTINNVYNFIESIDEEGNIGNALLIDMVIPENVHDKLNDYPPAPEHIAVNEEDISDYNKNQENLHGKVNHKVKKLMCTFYPKKEYLTDFRNLKYYIKLGCIITKVHKVYKYQMSPFLKPYIEYNNNQRAKAKSEAEKNYWKLQNNSVYGKMFENVRNRINLKLHNNDEELQKDVTDYRCKAWGIFNDNLFWAEISPKSVKLNKPIQIGFTILELSKLEMLKFFYDYLKPKYGDKVKLLATDTDSFILEVETEDFYKDMYNDMNDYYDMCDFPDEMRYANGEISFIVEDKNKNKKRLGFMKDEYSGRAVKEFIGLKSKMYSLLAEDDEEGPSEKKTAKGIKYLIKEKYLSHEDYRDALLNEKMISVKQCSFKSKDHKVFTEEVNKKALTGYDDKRYVLKDGIKTLAYGHYAISTDALAGK